MWYSPLEAAAGLLLLFVLPGFFTARALFPEWRLSGPEALTRGVETAALSWVVSTAYTVLVGTVLLNLPGAGFSSGWSDPVLEAALAAISGAAAVAAVARGGFSRTVPPARAPEPTGGEGGGMGTDAGTGGARSSGAAAPPRPPHRHGPRRLGTPQSGARAIGPSKGRPPPRPGGRVFRLNLPGAPPRRWCSSSGASSG